MAAQSSISFIRSSFSSSDAQYKKLRLEPSLHVKCFSFAMSLKPIQVKLDNGNFDKNKNNNEKDQKAYAL